MATPPAYRRLPLRDLITDAEKRSRDVAENLHTSLLAKLDDLHDLSRTVRKKSHFPTLIALHNSLSEVLELSRESDALLAYLEHQLDEIREHAQRERFNRN
jgi:C4-dicarboxylate-specific signal transduction histidine kinase